MARWYLLQSKLSAESVAQVNLERQGYEVYLPRLLRPTRRRGRWREQIVALFPRYLFLHLEEGGQSLGPVRSTLGVNDVVRFGVSPAIVPDHVVADLRSRADAATGLHRLDCAAALQPGTRVRVTSGPFDGLEGIFEREAGPDRVVLLLNLLGRDTRVRIPVDSVVPSREAERAVRC